jgi:hypothetical protein
MLPVDERRMTPEDLYLVNHAIENITKQANSVVDAGILAEISEFVCSMKLSTYTDSFFVHSVYEMREKNIFYLVQIIFDYGHTMIRDRDEDNGLGVQVWGFAKTRYSFGNTLMRPEDKVDRWVDYFIKSDINFEISKDFSDKYFLVSNNKGNVLENFNHDFLEQMAKYENLNLCIMDNRLLLGFQNQSISEAGIVDLIKIFTSMLFLEKA